MADVRVVTNNVPRDVIDAYQLTLTERTEFDYINWAGIDAGTDSASFFRYRGTLYDLHEFEHTTDRTEGSVLRQWDGVQTDTYFSATVVRYVENYERVIVGRVYT